MNGALNISRDGVYLNNINQNAFVYKCEDLKNGTPKKHDFPIIHEFESDVYRAHPSKPHHHQIKCKHCDNEYGPAIPCTYPPPNVNAWGNTMPLQDCEEIITCSVCGLTSKAYDKHGEFKYFPGQTNCTNDGFLKCEKCNTRKKYSETHHSNLWNPNNCTEPVTCQNPNCTQPFYPFSDHNFTSYYSKPNCTQGTIYKCTRCNKIDEAYYGSPLGHDFRGEYQKTSISPIHHNRKCLRCNTYGFNAEGMFTGDETWSEECRWVVNNRFDPTGDCTANVDRSDPLLNYRRCSMNCGNYSNMDSHDFSTNTYSKVIGNTTRHRQKCARCSVLGANNADNSEPCNFNTPNPNFNRVNCTTTDNVNTDNSYYRCDQNCGNYRGHSSSHDFTLTNTDSDVYRSSGSNTHQKRCNRCSVFGWLRNGNHSIAASESCNSYWVRDPSSNDCTSSFEKCGKDCGNTRSLNGATNSHSFTANASTSSDDYPIWRNRTSSNGTPQHQRKCGNHTDCRVYGRAGQIGTNTSSNTNGWDPCTYSFTDCTVETVCGTCGGNSKAHSPSHNFGGSYQKLGNGSAANPYRHYRKCNNHNSCTVYGLNNGVPNPIEATELCSGWVHNGGTDCTSSSFMRCGSFCGNTKAHSTNGHTLPPYTTDCTAYLTCSVSNCTQIAGRHYGSHSWQLKTAATCFNAQIDKCSRTGCTAERTNGGALGHSWGSWQNNTSNHIRYCTRANCNGSETEAHSFTGTVISTTSTTHRRRCTSCTATQDQDHTYSVGGSSITASYRACPGSKQRLPCNVSGCGNIADVNTANHDNSGTSGAIRCNRCGLRIGATNYFEWQCTAMVTQQGSSVQTTCGTWLCIERDTGRITACTNSNCGKGWSWSGSGNMAVQVSGG